MTDPAQRAAGEFLSNTPPNFRSGSKPTTFVHLLDGRIPEPGEVTAENLDRVELRHHLVCDRCTRRGQGGGLYLRPERLWRLLDAASLAGKDEVSLSWLESINGRM